MIARITGVAGVQLIKSLIYLILSLRFADTRWGSTHKIPDILANAARVAHGPAGVQLIKSLIYLSRTATQHLGGWGSTHKIPDILELASVLFPALLGFNS